MIDRALRLHEVIRLAAISHSRIYRAIRDQGFPRATVKVGRERLWLESDVIKWMEGRA